MHKEAELQLSSIGGGVVDLHFDPGYWAIGEFMELDRDLAAAFASDPRKRTAISEVEECRDLHVMREQRLKLARLWSESLDWFGVHCKTLRIPSPSGVGAMQLRTYRPAKPAKRRSCVFHVHGGGQIAGTPLMDDPILVPWVRELQCVATSIDYRLAPEHPAPAGAEDCYAALCWIHDHPDLLGIDPTRIMLAGMSGGGGIAATTALMARDRGEPKLRFLLLACPMLDDRGKTPSSQGEWLLWTKELNRFAWDAILVGRTGSVSVRAYQAAARAENLCGLPPTYIDVGALEVFRDECVEFARSLLVAEVSTELHVYPGCFHGFDLFSPNAPISRLAAANRIAALRRAMHSSG